MIDHIMIMNLEKREDKWWFALGWLAHRGVPFSGLNALWGDTIIRFISHDGEHYGDTESVIDAAVADGFDFFPLFSSIEKYRDVAWCWTWCSALRKIVEMNKTVMLLIDDSLPLWDWRRLCSLVVPCHEGESEHGAFRALQLNTELPLNKIIPTPPEPYSSVLAKGFRGKGDYGFILNASGAQMLLNKKTTDPPGSVIPCGDITEIARDGIENKEYYSGLWHTLENIVFHTTQIDWKSDLYR